ncbi:uncharacterized protein PV09_04665 [Verruconis gallopava]|uniref:Uncharacterized protein n=1 Tax=Verruconis gallopava TaxID=253628 RepID=A0A0D1XP87_9PEZI|nr:uncharacterized protein PV09_04665 [Verruconis gallopava]KIW04381.1 hypothetical protein PV09_04665 [Verruconis gallopava]
MSQARVLPSSRHLSKWYVTKLLDIIRDDRSLADNSLDVSQKKRTPFQLFFFTAGQVAFSNSYQCLISLGINMSQQKCPFILLHHLCQAILLVQGHSQDQAWVGEDPARIINNALKMLGFDQYVVQGGDVGCLIASLLGTTYDSVIGAHLNLLPSLDQVEVNDPNLTEMERKAVQRSKERFQTPTVGAAIMNST